MTRSYGYDAATGVLSVVRAGWVLDDVDRFASRVDNVAGSTRSYSYGDAGHPFAVTSVSGVGVYGYDQVGAMVSRAGGTLVYDAMHRLVAHAGESYVQSTGNQRLVVTGPAGRVLYLGEVEVTANGPARTVTRHVTIEGTVVAVTTTTGSGTAVVWSCAHPQNSVTCHAPTSGATPGVRRYHPYGTARNSVTTPATTRGFLGQPADTTGLAYLDNRYYDPDLGVFLSVDPLVAKTGDPYLYAAGNPTTLSDPSGLSPGDACAGTNRTSGSACARATYDELASRPRSTGPGPHDTVISDETWAFDQEVAGGAATATISFGLLGQLGAEAMSPAMRLAYLHVGSLWLGGALASDGSGGLRPAGSLPYVYYNARTYVDFDAASGSRREIETLFTGHKRDDLADIAELVGSTSFVTLVVAGGACVGGVVAACPIAGYAATANAASSAYTAIDTCFGGGSGRACRGAAFDVLLGLVRVGRAGPEGAQLLTIMTTVVGSGVSIFTADPRTSGSDVLLVVSTGTS